MKDNKPVIFYCSYCQASWESERKKYKIRITKTTGQKIWKQYISKCPVCDRETTETEYMEKRSVF